MPMAALALAEGWKLLEKGPPPFATVSRQKGLVEPSGEQGGGPWAPGSGVWYCESGAGLCPVPSLGQPWGCWGAQRGHEKGSEQATVGAESCRTAPV